MFFEPAEITDLLNCENCSQQYGEYYPPRILPCCGKTICYKCVKLNEQESKENKFKCIACNEYETMPNNGFQINSIVVKLIAKQPKEISRGHEAEKLKQNVRDLEAQVKKLLFEMNNGDYFIREDCNELRVQVQLVKEEKIREIDQLCDALLKKIDAYEEMSLLKYKENIEKHQQTNELINLVNDSIKQQNAYLMQLKIDDKETITCNETMNELKEKIEKESKTLKKLMFDNQIIKFEANLTSVDEEFLGKLVPDKFEIDVIKTLNMKR